MKFSSGKELKEVKAFINDFGSLFIRAERKDGAWMSINTKGIVAIHGPMDICPHSSKEVFYEGDIIEIRL